MQPSEFWLLSTTEFWWEFDARVKAQKKLKKYHEDPKTKPKFSEADWEAARKKFKEKFG